MKPQQPPSCSTCLLRPKADGGKGGCPRTESYPALSLLDSHDCPLWKRTPQTRQVPAPPQQDGLF